MKLKTQFLITIEPHAWADGRFCWLYAAVRVVHKFKRTLGAV